MPRLRAFLRNPFSFLFAGTAREERVAEYLIREHRRGRRLDDVLKDHYVQNRLSPAQQARLLERQDVIDAVSTDDLEAARRSIASVSGETA
ncbi:MAG: hypothetical protein IRZ20_07920 [Thermoleophilia bacterium]|nr:hypothetical protein [Thermoleophilia bacterium]